MSWTLQKTHTIEIEQKRAMYLVDMKNSGKFGDVHITDIMLI